MQNVWVVNSDSTIIGLIATWQQKVKMRLTLHNLLIDNVMIQSEPRYLTGANIVNLKCRVFGGKTGPFQKV